MSKAKEFMTEGQIAALNTQVNEKDRMSYSDSVPNHKSLFGISDNQVTRGSFVDYPDTGTKHDTGKSQVSLVPRELIEGVAQVLAFGAQKYGKHNWKKGLEHERLVDAIGRHWLAIASGEANDPESGLPHVFHIAANCGFIAFFDKNKKD